MEFFDNVPSLPGGSSRQVRSAHEAVNGCFDPVPVTQLGDARVVVNAQLLIAGMAASDLSGAVLMAGNVARVRGAMSIEKKRYEAVPKYLFRKGEAPVSRDREELIDALCEVDRVEFESLSAMGLLHLFEATCRVMAVPRDSVEFAQLEESLLLPRLKARETSAAAVRTERAARAASEGRAVAEADAEIEADIAKIATRTAAPNKVKRAASGWRWAGVILFLLATMVASAALLGATLRKVDRERAAHAQSFVQPETARRLILPALREPMAESSADDANGRAARPARGK